MHKTQLSVGLGRAIIAIAIASATAGAFAVGCGGGGGGSNQGLEGPVAPGFFVGNTAQGHPIAVRVADSVNGVFISCGGGEFDFRQPKPEQPGQPPLSAPIAADGSFSVTLVDDAHLRTVVVSGIFLDQDRATGTITGDPFCEGDFSVTRCAAGDLKCEDKDGDLIPDIFDPNKGGRVTVTPTPTATATKTPTPTPTATGLTPTPTAATPTPQATETPNPRLCGNGDLDAGEQCDPGGGGIEPDLDGNACDDLCMADQEDSATLKCTAGCKFDFSSCTRPSTCTVPATE